MPDLSFPTQPTVFYVSPRPPWWRRLMSWVRRDPVAMRLGTDGEITTLTRREAKGIRLR